MKIPRLTITQAQRRIYLLVSWQATIDNTYMRYLSVLYLAKLNCISYFFYCFSFCSRLPSSKGWITTDEESIIPSSQDHSLFIGAPIKGQALVFSNEI
jgi:hypothetical protein